MHLWVISNIFKENEHLFHMERNRKNKTFRLDELVITGLNSLAKKRNTSANRLLENELFKLLKSEGIIEKTTEPLGETRGGDRTSTEQRKKIKPQDTFIDIIKQHYWKLKECKIKNIEALANGGKPSKADLVRISSALNIDFYIIEALAEEVPGIRNGSPENH